VFLVNAFMFLQGILSLGDALEQENAR